MNPDTSDGAFLDDDRLGALLAEWLEASKGSEPPDPKRFIAAHPEYAPQLQRCLANWNRFQRWAKPLRAILGQAPSPLTDASGWHASGSHASGLRALGSGRLASDDATINAGQTSGEDTVRVRPGRIIADYEILEELGRGGMGVVYRARQRSLDRLVAVKVMRSGGDGSLADQARFRNEATIAACLDHPAIVPIYEVGAHNGRPFFSMKLIEGGNLVEHLSRFRHDPRAAARVVATVARAVHHAHQRGILHRDLKPSNILLDKAGQPHITDFGLAKVLSGDSTLTQTGIFLGTPSYMAPEQARGGKGAVTTATDVYGLGAVLYALLTGKPPFREETVLETVQKVQSDDPVPPSAVGQRVPADVQTICLKCLEKSPGRRYPSAEALAEDLERWLAGEPIKARPARWWERAAKWVRRRPAAAALIVVTLFAILGALVGLTLYNQQLGEALATSDRLRSEGLEREARLQRHLYVADVRAARRAWENGEHAQAVALLEHQLADADKEDLRDFGWRQLWAASHYTPRLLGQHASAALSVAISPDDRWVVSGDKDGVVKIWDAASGACVHQLDGPVCEIGALRFSPDGKTLAIAEGRLMIRLVEVPSWQNKGVLLGFVNTICSVEFSPDGTLLAAGLRDDTVKIWDLAQKKLRSSWKGHTDAVQSVSWSADGKQIVSSSNDCSIKVWDVAAGKETIGFPGAHASTVFAAAFVPRSTLVVSASFDRWIRFHDLRTRTDWAAHLMTGPAYSAAVAPDGRWFVAVGNYGALSVADICSAWRAVQPRHLYRDGNAYLRRVAIDGQGKFFATADDEGRVKLWDVAKFTGVQSTAYPRVIVGMSADAGRVVWQDEKGRVIVWDPTHSKLVKELGESPQVDRAVFAPDGKSLATIDAQNSVRIYDLAGGRPVLRIAAEMPIVGVCFSHSGRWIATGHADCGVSLWDLGESVPAGQARRLVLRQSVPKTLYVAHLQFSPDDRTLYSAVSPDKEIDIWDVADGKRRAALPTDSEEVRALALSPDGRLLAAGLDDRSIRIWDLTTGREQATLMGHKHFITGLRFSPKGQTLVSTSDDATVRLWHVPTAQELYTLHTCRDLPRTAAFSPDGNMLRVMCGTRATQPELLTWSVEKD